MCTSSDRDGPYKHPKGFFYRTLPNLVHGQTVEQKKTVKSKSVRIQLIGILASDSIY